MRARHLVQSLVLVEGECEELEDDLVGDLIIEGASSKVRFRFHLLCAYLFKLTH